MQAGLDAGLKPGNGGRVRWYKEPWVWLVISGPSIVVCAALYTAFLAYKGADKVVAEDYYRQGLMVNKDIRRDANARERKMSADMRFDSSTGNITVKVQSDVALPSTLLLSIAESSSSSSVNELIRRGTLLQLTPGIYQLSFPQPTAMERNKIAIWHIKIEASDWRLTSDWHDPMHKPLQLNAVN
jgi:hypothetical protein